MAAIELADRSTGDWGMGPGGSCQDSLLNGSGQRREIRAGQD